MRRILVQLVLLSTLLFSCMGGVDDGGVVGPLPQPVYELTGFNAELITLTRGGEQTTITGAENAALGHPVTIVAHNLDRRVAWVQAAVEPDGSFVVAIEGTPDESFRLHAQGLIDITSSAEGGAAAEVEQQSCLLSEMFYFVDGPMVRFFNGAGYLHLENGCGSPVQLIDASLYDTDSFSFPTDLLGTELAAGAQAELEILVECSSPGQLLDILFLETDIGRVIVSLVAECQ